MPSPALPPADPVPGLRAALVTGGAGFVGYAVVAALVRRGVTVRVLDPGAPHPDWPRGVEHRRGDVRDHAEVARCAAGMDAIFHVAGVWDSRPGGEDRMRALNVGGAEAVLAVGAPTVLTSSSITCGYGPRARPGREEEPSEDPTRPIRGTGAVYRQTKLAAEALAAARGAWIVNPDYVVGPGDVRGVVTGPLLMAARLPLIPAPGGGKCFVGVHDVGEAHVLALLRGQPGRRYLIGAENRTYRDVLATLARGLGRRPRVLPLPSRLSAALASVPALRPLAGPLEQMSLDRYRDSSRARQELGWRPAPVDEALAALAREARRG